MPKNLIIVTPKAKGTITVTPKPSLIPTPQNILQKIYLHQKATVPANKAKYTA